MNGENELNNTRRLIVDGAGGLKEKVEFREENSIEKRKRVAQSVPLLKMISTKGAAHKKGAGMSYRWEVKVHTCKR